MTKKNPSATHFYLVPAVRWMKKKIGAPLKIILDDKKSKIKKHKKLDKIVTSTPGTGMLFLISPKAQQFFEKLKIQNLQFIDVNLAGKDVHIADYKIVNITNKIDCIDVEKSKVTFQDDLIQFLESLVLDESKIPTDQKIFLLDRKNTAIILIHEHLKNEIQKSDLTGFKFLDLTDAGQIY